MKVIRAPRVAAAAGIVFGLLLGASIVLIQITVPDDQAEAGSWVEDDSKRRFALFAPNLLPFAGIAFLWFIGVIRDRLGEGEDRFFATVFLGSGLLFIAMLFVTGAVAGSLIVAAHETQGELSPELWAFGSGTGLSLFSIYTMRMAGVFTVSTLSLLLRLHLIPMWLALPGAASAVVLLIGSGRIPWVGLVFPAWILALSTYFLITMMRDSRVRTRPVNE
jgi:hypothetical protein